MTTTTRLLLSAACLLSLSAFAEAPGDATAGKAVFQQNCVICHGNAGKGDGPAAAGLTPKPANFSERLASSEDKQRNVVTNGGAAEKLSPLMPSFGEALSAQQIRDVVAFVRGDLAGLKTAKK